MELVIIILLGLIAAGVIYLAYALQRPRAADLSALKGGLEGSIDQLSRQMSSVAALVNEQLTSVTMQMHASTGQVSNRMDSASRMFAEVRQNLGELSKATERIFGVGKDISSLHDILRAPKLRGALGEFFLGDLLAQCLPGANYDLQYTFKNGLRVDAVIKLQGGVVPVDSKFPLENFKKSLEAATEEDRKTARRRFAADCKRHIDAIASSYINTAEGTLNFALMYIPAENVFYETIIKDDSIDGVNISDYAFSRRVVPVSPNSFYAYLQTILLGMRGVEISERAHDMLTHLDRLRADFDRFLGDFDTLGKHINNTKAKYDEAQRKAERFSYALDSAALPGEQAQPDGAKKVVTAAQPPLK